MNTNLTTMLLLTLAGGAIFFANQNFAADLAINSFKQAKETEPFKIIAQLTQKRFHTNETISVHVKLKNITKTNQSVVIWSCSWWQQFRPTSSQLTLWPGYNCIANAPLPVEIPAGKTWEKELKLCVSEPVLTNKISFRIRFVPLDYVRPRFEGGHFTSLVLNDSKISFLSNEATIDLISN